METVLACWVFFCLSVSVLTQIVRQVTNRYKNGRFAAKKGRFVRVCPEGAATRELLGVPYGHNLMIEPLSPP